MSERYTRDELARLGLEPCAFCAHNTPGTWEIVVRRRGGPGRPRRGDRDRFAVCEAHAREVREALWARRTGLGADRPFARK